MASKGEGFRTMSGQTESAEPAQAPQTSTTTPSTTTTTASTATSTNSAAPFSSRSSRDSSPATIRHASSTTSVPSLRKQPSVNLHTPHIRPTNGNSPHTSRNTSPIRPSRSGYDTPQPPARPSGTALRSRQNSQDASPHRPAALSTPTGTVPSAAAIQRALSATSVPQLSAGPVTEAVSKLPKMQQRAAGGPGSGDNTPVWPQSPRLKSPPPSTVRSRRNSSLGQRAPAIAPSISVQSSTPTGSTPPPNPLTEDGGKNAGEGGKNGKSAEAKKETKKEDQTQQQLQPTAAAKAPSRGPSGPRPMLETVEENTPPNSLVPQVLAQTPQPVRPAARTSDDDKPPAVTSTTLRGKPSGYISDATSRLAESESEGNRSGDGKPRQSSQDTQPGPRPKAVTGVRATYPVLSSAKSRQPEGPRNMTVETETVASVPQTNIGGNGNPGDRGRLDGGSLRMKPSTETIRPRKDRKRTSRKAPSVNNGTASSKADIFEARVANQVDEQGSSSDETFVYESNTEPQERSRRHHSRTPSGTSLHSQSEYRHGIRNYAGIHASGDHRVAGKRSMKFSNNPYNILDSPTDDGNGTVRAHARHIGRLGRAGGSGSRASLYGQDSPFTQASKVRNSDFHTSRPGSPKSMNSTQHRPSSLLFGRKNDLDIEGGEGDDERTPLTGTVRTPRSTRLHGRRYNDSVRSYTHSNDMVSSPNHPHSYSSSRSSSSSRLSRFGGCLFGLVIFVLVVLGAVGFLVMSNKPLYGFEVDKIENVLASEQEIMLDLLVGAVNPNVLGVTIGEMDLNVFAKSKYVSPIGGGHILTSHKRKIKGVVVQDWQDQDGHWHEGDGPVPGEDEGTDPVEGDSQTMLLGRIFHFDSALSFDGSPLKRHVHHSMGEVRLAQPGNKTEMGGSERWERVLQYPFELILRGVLKYQLPVSSRVQSAAIGASVIVHPEEGVDHRGAMRIEIPDEKEKWHWVELGDAQEDEGEDDEGRHERTNWLWTGL